MDLESPAAQRLIRDIAREVAASLPKMTKPFIKRVELNELVGEKMATKLIDSGKIKYRMVEGQRVLLRREYENYIAKIK